MVMIPFQFGRIYLENSNKNGHIQWLPLPIHFGTIYLENCNKINDIEWLP